MLPDDGRSFTTATRLGLDQPEDDVAAALAGAAQSAQPVEDSRIASLNLPISLSPSLAAMLTQAAHRLARVQGGDS
jgi:hypothetical protein